MKVSFLIILLLFASGVGAEANFPPCPTFESLDKDRDGLITADISKIIKNETFISAVLEKRGQLHLPNDQMKLSLPTS